MVINPLKKIIRKEGNEGENLTFLNVASETNFDKFKMLGNSTQSIRDGKNKVIFDDKEATTTNGITYSIKDGIITINGTAEGIVNFFGNDFNIAADTYTLSKNASGSYNIGTGSSNSSIIIQEKDNNTYNTKIEWRASENNNSTKTSFSNGTYRAIIFIAPGNTFNNFVIRPQLEKGEISTDFEQRGISPSIDYPSEIKNVTGNIGITVCNKNLFNKNNYNELNAKVENSTIVSNVAERMIFFRCKKNCKYSFTKKLGTNYRRLTVGETIDVPASGVAIQNYISFPNSASSEPYSLSFTTSEKAKYIIVWYYCTGSNLTQQEILDSFQIEEGEITDFVQNKEQSFIFPLENGQILMTDDYLASDGIHHKKKKIILTGNETIGRVAQRENTFGFSINSYATITDSSNRINIKSNIAKAKIAAEANTIKFASNSANIIIEVDNGFSEYTVSAIKEKIQGMYNGGTPIIIEIPLLEEEIEQYTSEQNTVYDGIMEAIHPYKGETHIFSSNDICLIFDVKVDILKRKVAMIGDTIRIQ